MKFNTAVSSSRSVNRKAHFNADRHVRAYKMAAPLSKELKTEHKIRAMPVRVGDMVKVVKGSEKVRVEGKIIRVDRLTYKVHVEGANHKQRSNEDKAKTIPVSPSNCVITKLHMNGSRTKKIASKSKKE
ncbi:Ribosomal protein L26 [Spironucleus salmonicida]|uniref:Ribosomal protein L26 n=1 Tax=Spironucleus salmonicida TaxID=348837 RepID=V6LU03_9EUKA|nr:Ribosomal protein L26 [Spironucleus salmonicida]|eukprot:EST44264.1 Ribosomal protein L26 [Spironucleus salmonicida]